MLKRKKGFLLLTMLVLTGLAGRLHSDTLLNKERRFLITELKDSRAFFLKAIDGLSEKQLTFHLPGRNISIKDLIYREAMIEFIFWENTKYSLAKPGNQPENAVIPDIDINDKLKQTGFLKPLEVLPTPAYETVEAAIKNFNQERKESIQYVRTVTGNPRLNFTISPIGKLNIYQTLSLSSKYTFYYCRQIEKIRSLKSFPKN